LFLALVWTEERTRTRPPLTKKSASAASEDRREKKREKEKEREREMILSSLRQQLFLTDENNAALSE
jgi:hypothetical protein